MKIVDSTTSSWLDLQIYRDHAYLKSTKMNRFHVTFCVSKLVQNNFLACLNVPRFIMSELWQACYHPAMITFLYLYVWETKEIDHRLWEKKLCQKIVVWIWQLIWTYGQGCLYINLFCSIYDFCAQLQACWKDSYSF